MSRRADRRRSEKRRNSFTNEEISALLVSYFWAGFAYKHAAPQAELGELLTKQQYQQMMRNILDATPGAIQDLDVRNHLAQFLGHFVHPDNLAHWPEWSTLAQQMKDAVEKARQANAIILPPGVSEKPRLVLAQ